MRKEFEYELNKAKEAEWIVRCVLAHASLDKANWNVDANIYYFDDCADNKEFWHIGDISVTNSLLEEKEKERTVYIDIKDDKCIHRTGNIFAEEAKIFNGCTELSDGFMRNSNYDYLAICSRPDNKIYIVDFKKLKKVYKQGKYVTSYLSDATCYGFIYPLWKAKDKGIVKYEIEYAKSFDYWLDDKGNNTLTLYEPVKVNKIVA